MIRGQSQGQMSPLCLLTPTLLHLTSALPASILHSSSLRNIATPHSLHCLSRQLMRGTPSLQQIVWLINAGRDSIGSLSRPLRTFIFSIGLMHTSHRHCLKGVFVNDTARSFDVASECSRTFPPTLTGFAGKARSTL